MRALMATTAIAGNTAMYIYFHNAWWAGKKHSFWINNDWGQPFRDADKFGHALGGYHLARISTEMLKASCVSEKKSMWIGAAYAAAFQVQIEIWDGLQAKYGFSPPDILANSTGTAFATLQEAHPYLEHFKPTFSYHQSAEYKNRAVNGTDLHPSTDYAGQTYWMSTDVDGLLSDKYKKLWPGILRVSVGHSVTDWVDPVTGRTHPAKRRVLLTLDFDPEKLPGQNRYWKEVKHELSFLHFPAPALQIAPTFKGISWYQ